MRRRRLPEGTSPGSGSGPPSPGAGLRPPLLVRWLLRLRLGPDDRRAVESELAELFERRRARDGERAAEAWLRRQWAQYPARLLFSARRLPLTPRPVPGRRPLER
ncbi:MAG TPA: hypothetical protein VJG13_09810, partial [Thermoanaerobaculia bacterium]|nr:hypothetical protein [Thermoanaerobaculia bacterium]